MIERDTIDHWLHGRFQFLMGDDKSSWFHLLRNGWNMLYLPDVNCVSLESRDESFLRASMSLPYRWFGNTMRNNPRALALGPWRTGWFIWFVLLDQRVSMWTSLVGITGAAVLAVTKSAAVPAAVRGLGGAGAQRAAAGDRLARPCRDAAHGAHHAVHAMGGRAGEDPRLAPPVRPELEQGQGEAEGALAWAAWAAGSRPAAC
jgi:hypothetical protein